MAAGLAQLSYLRDHGEVYGRIAGLGKRLFAGLEDIVRRRGAPCCVNYIGSLGSLFFTPGPITDFPSALKSDTAAYATYFNHLIERGILMAPAQFEALFVSAAHGEDEIDRTLEAAEDFFKSA
jgi:glutamate-1-semialdehyde 2,1-aminomutase